MPRTVGYARVSTTKQEDAGLSLEAQKRRLIEAGATEVLVDVMSGAKDHRPQFRELMRMVKAREVETVLVCKLDRLTRSITARAELYQAFTAPGAPVLKALDDGIDMSTASGRQMFDLLGALATGERERIRERINDGLNARRALGLYVGQTPWGLRLTRTGCGVEIDPEKQPEVEAVLQVMWEERTLTAVAKRISEEVGVSKSRATWRTWINSPALCGNLPHGSKDKGVPFRQYASITPAAFTSYLTPVEHQQLLQKFTNARRGPRQHGPEHPTRGRVLCGCCGKPMQRRLDHNRKPRWLLCGDIYCDLGRRSTSIDDATHALLKAAFHFGSQILHKRAQLLNSQKQNKGQDPREAELQSTIKALKAMDQSIVGTALEAAERELLTRQQQHETAAAVTGLNIERVMDLMGFVVGWRMQDLNDSDSWSQLVDLLQLVPVNLISREDKTKTFGGKPVITLDRAVFHRGTEMEESIAVEDLPPIPEKGGTMKWEELSLALRSSAIC